MKYGLLLLLLMLGINVFAQQKTVDGIIFDKSSKERIAKVNVTNITTGKSVYNNLKGEFVINAQPGDQLVFTRIEYKPDTVKLQDLKSMAVYLDPIAIQLRQVDVHDTALTPEKRLAAVKREFNRIYSPSLNPDYFATSPGGGVGLSIDALWNAFSRSGQNAAHLRETIEKDHQQEVIDYRFNKTFVASVTKLKEPQLTEFMRKYRPGYFTVTTYSDYEFLTYIKSALRRYQRNPRSLYQQKLPVIKPESQFVMPDIPAPKTN